MPSKVGLPTLVKAAKVARHTSFFKVDGLAALGASFAQEAVAVCLLFIGSAL